MIRRCRVPSAALCAAAALVLAGCSSPAPEPESAPAETTVEAQAAPVAPPTPAEPAPPGAPAPVDIESLPPLNADAEAVIPSLPTDPTPGAPFSGEVLVVGEPTAVYDAAGGTPVGRLDALTYASPTRTPVLNREGDWVLVLVPWARAGLPSEGVTGAAVGWVWTGDGGVEVVPEARLITVSLTEGTMALSDGGVVEWTAPVAVGKAATPTPTGRSSVASVYTDPIASYTDGEPILALATFSGVLDTFTPLYSDASAPPLLAIHYYDGVSSGAVSNGCLRATREAVRALAGLPDATGIPVAIVP